MSAPDLSESRDLAAMWRERAEAAEALTQRLAAAVWAAIGHRDPPPLDGLPAEECMVVASEVRLRLDGLAMARDNHHARAERAEAARDAARTEARVLREECDGLMHSVETIAWERDALRAIVEGREVAP